MENDVEIKTTTSVKICGIMNLDTVRALAELPIDQVGFIFAPSKRQVTPKQAGEMIALLKNVYAEHDLTTPQTVGVFVNPTQELISETMAKAKLDIIQLHSPEPVEFCQWIKETFDVKIYKVISVSESSQIQQQLRLLQSYVGVVDAILLDTYDPIVGGGTGKTFAWHCIKEYLAWTKQRGLQLIVAGGLDEENVSQLIADYHPDGVDISSGVETDGSKDPLKIKRFVERVKGL
ncbi:phosphoribosylanthranilate isomerase [Paenibacillus psychroresistens]|uniref:N-(5'-phosphoribosyl)anthranilate isomerase n=1 Tax=Paenibacillus psychroresistens TaxID=1778678 RepID=A0A6B8RM85_9BACL|nr:phosphoribosylanthranilate isomerase [Paenibacillus psychroresistens]QGQ96864.1 phosphoribosylanthranilate isomerase [Paenibacillus psychroresistens]